MIGVPHTHTAKLTGRMRLRASWTGRPIAQVEEEHETRHRYGEQRIAHWYAWRDARRSDLVVGPPAPFPPPEQEGKR